MATHPKSHDRSHVCAPATRRDSWLRLGLVTLLGMFGCGRCGNHSEVEPVQQVLVPSTIEAPPVASPPPERTGTPFHTPEPTPVAPLDNAPPVVPVEVPDRRDAQATAIEKNVAPADTAPTRVAPADPNVDFAPAAETHFAPPDVADVDFAHADTADVHFVPPVAAHFAPADTADVHFVPPADAIPRAQPAPH